MVNTQKISVFLLTRAITGNIVSLDILRLNNLSKKYECTMPNHIFIS